MRILQVHNAYQQAGGEDAVVEQEGALLAGRGHDVRLWSVSNDEIGGAWAKLRTAWQVPYSQGARRQLGRVIADFAPDVVHVHNFFPLITPSVYDACRDAGVPVVQTLHNYRTICAGALLLRNGRPCEDCIGGSPYQGALHGCYRGSR
ncbi:MAG: glycosyltransferase, partial [Gammaproteobacteria bacterium]